VTGGRAGISKILYPSGYILLIVATDIVVTGGRAGSNYAP